MSDDLEDFRFEFGAEATIEFEKLSRQKPELDYESFVIGRKYGLRYAAELAGWKKA